MENYRLEIHFSKENDDDATNIAEVIVATFNGPSNNTVAPTGFNLLKYQMVRQPQWRLIKEWKK